MNCEKLQRRIFCLQKTKMSLENVKKQKKVNCQSKRTIVKVNAH